jgi:hypothetical protein
MKYYKNDGIPIKNLKYDKVVGKYKNFWNRLILLYNLLLKLNRELRERLGTHRSIFKQP